MGYMHSYLVVMTSPPLYRLFPTKAYKQYAEPLKKLHKAGKRMYIFYYRIYCRKIQHLYNYSTL